MNLFVRQRRKRNDAQTLDRHRRHVAEALMTEAAKLQRQSPVTEEGRCQTPGDWHRRADRVRV